MLWVPEQIDIRPVRSVSWTLFHNSPPTYATSKALRTVLLMPCLVSQWGQFDPTIQLTSTSQLWPLLNRVTKSLTASSREHPLWLFSLCDCQIQMSLLSVIHPLDTHVHTCRRLLGAVSSMLCMGCHTLGFEQLRSSLPVDMCGLALTQTFAGGPRHACSANGQKFRGTPRHHSSHSPCLTNVSTRSTLT